MRSPKHAEETDRRTRVEFDVPLEIPGGMTIEAIKAAVKEKIKSLVPPEVWAAAEAGKLN